MYKKRILITGCAGYIGSVLTKKLKNKTSGIDKQSPKIKNNQFKKINILDKKKLYKFIQLFKPNIVIHLAAESTIDNVLLKKKSYKNNNIVGTQNLLDCLKNIDVKKFIFSSTASVYENSNKILLESDQIKPDNIYSKTKYTNEIQIKKFFKNKKTSIY